MLSPLPKSAGDKQSLSDWVDKETEGLTYSINVL